MHFSLSLSEISLQMLRPKSMFNSGVTNTGNGERGTGNGERGTGNGERESGNKCTAVIRIRIQNGGRKQGKGSGNQSLNSIVGANNMDSKCSIY